MPPRGRSRERRPLVDEDDDVDGAQDNNNNHDNGEESEVFHDEAEREFLEENEEELEKALTEDIYSLLYTANTCGLTYVFATFIFVLQGGLLVLIFVDLVDMSSEPNETNGVVNRMDLPAGASIEVTIAQVSW